MIAIGEAVVWVATRDQLKVDEWCIRPGAAFDRLFGLGSSELRKPGSALMAAIESGRLIVFGTRPGDEVCQAIPTETWGLHGLQLFGDDGERYAGKGGIYAARSRQDRAAFFDLAIRKADLLQAFPAAIAEGAKRRGRPPRVGERVGAEIEAMRAEGFDTRAMGEKALAKELKERGVDASPRTVGRINRGE
jgi:hypothetical protein